MQHHLINHFFL
jgi:IS30 family transposase